MQQINLYKENLRKKVLLLSMQHLSQATLALVVLLGLWHGVNIYQLTSLQTDINHAKTMLATKQKKLQHLEARLPKLRKDPKFQNQLSLLEKDLVNKQAVLSILSNQKLGNTKGFTAYFEGLARQTINGLWLTKLYFMQGGRQLNIQGQLKQPELLPKYLQALSNEAIFKGTEFKHFIIQREDKNKALSFVLNNIDSNANTATSQYSSALSSQ